MMDHPDQLQHDIMEDPYDTSDLMDKIDDVLAHHSDLDITRNHNIADMIHKFNRIRDLVLPDHSDIHFTRNQHIANMTHKFKSISGTKITVNIDFKNKQQRFWRSHEGVVTRISDRSFLPRVFPFSLTYVLEDNPNELWSPVKRHSLIRQLIFLFNLTSLDVLAELETQLSLCLLNWVSNSNDEGYSAFCADVVLEVATVDIYDEEDLAWEEVALDTEEVAWEEVALDTEEVAWEEVALDTEEVAWEEVALEEVALDTIVGPESSSCCSPI